MIDFTLVAGLRPELLIKTLDSLKDNSDLFELKVRCICNIDPFGAEKIQNHEIVEILNSYFENILLNTPSTPSFSKAVKWLWSNTSSNQVIHFEDDWVLLEEVSFESLFKEIGIKTKCVSLMTKHKNLKNRKVYHDKWNTLKSIAKTKQLKKPIFTTSPCVYDGGFLRTCSELLDLNFDPEKQFYSGVNSHLENYVRPYKNKVFRGEKNQVIMDIGRNWHKENNIQKKSKGGVSIWLDKV